MNRNEGIMRVHGLLSDSFGPLGWWPADSRFEMIVGAVLTQQTSWKNVELAIGNLRAARMLDLRKMAHARQGELQRLIRPSGYYRQKAARLRGICASILERYGGLERMLKLDLPRQREFLLSLNGIGKETADAIILYAAEKPTFVVDAYTLRAVSRIFGIRGLDYDRTKALFEGALRPDVALYNEMHAQFVELGKRHCRVKPACDGCPLEGLCQYGKNRPR